MAKIKVSELFGPAGYWTYTLQDTGAFESKFVERYGVTQGEGKYVGKPSTFIRVYGCNLECRGFGLPNGEKTTEPEEIVAQITMYKSVSDLPVPKYGCDSFYSWHPGTKHLSPMMSTENIATEALRTVGGSFFKNKIDPVHLILTGGEPMLGWQRAYVDLVREIKSQDSVWVTDDSLKLPLTFETNGTKPINHEAISALQEMCNITWSVSPKLTVSGHTHQEAIKPTIVREYLDHSTDMYLKFVVQDVEDFDELDAVVRMYRDAGVDVPVYVMAEGGVPSEYKKHATVELVSEAVKRGYSISPRLHVLIGDNAMSW